MPGKILLINTNIMRPRVAPIGLDYLASALTGAGADVHFFDLAMEGGDWKSRLQRMLNALQPHLVGITIRNIDDCYFLSGQFLVSPVKQLVAWLRKNTEAKIVVGGGGYSIAPRALLEYIGADWGIWGDGEEAVVKLLNTVASDRTPKPDDIPGLVLPGAKFPQRAEANLARLKFNRKLPNNSLYFRLGGQIGVETKRGCSGKCIYCADPLAKGTRMRMRKPEAVADEIEALVAVGATAFHICDSEFNRPYAHAEAVLREIIRRKLGKKVEFYGYFSPKPFDLALAKLFARAGGKGICFGADSGSDEMLATLKRDHNAADIELAVKACAKAGVKTMCDLLLGGPGETRESLAETIALMKKIKPDRVGISYGLRVYAGTELSDIVRKSGGATLTARRVKEAGNAFPEFYLSPALRKDGLKYLRKIVGKDPRFFLPAEVTKKQNYNYSGNFYLEDLIRKGARGAYWKILLDDAR